MSNESGIPTFTKDRLPEPPECKWADFRKVTTTRAAKILGPFNVETIHGGAPQRCESGWLALDSEGYPYPIADEVFDSTFEPAVERGPIGQSDRNLPNPPGEETEMQGEARRLDEVEQAGHRIDTAKVIPRPGEKAPDGWQETPPAEGTRRALIRDAIAESVTEHFAPGAGTIESRDSFALKIADAVEQALIDATEIPTEVEQEVRRLQGTVDRLEGIAEERWQRIGELETDVEARQATIDGLAATVSMQADQLEQVDNVRKGGNRLDAIELAIERVWGNRKSWPVTPTKIALVVEAEVRAIEKLAKQGIAEVMADAPDREAELLEQREEARTREGRFAEERDCAFALLRWLLPVAVVKRLD